MSTFPHSPSAIDAALHQASRGFKPDAAFRFRSASRPGLAGFGLALGLALALMVPAAKAITIPEAVDATNLVWTTGGSAGAPPWVGQATTTHDGVDAAQSGAIGNSKTTYVETTIVGPGKLSFWWKVSSESVPLTTIYYDYLSLTVNGVLPSSGWKIGGEVNWQQRIFFLPAGTNTVRWSYVKDGSDPFVFPWDDKAWLDQVVFAPTVTTTNDSGPGSLRQAIADASATATILFDPSLSGSTILLTNGQITLDKSISIDASALPGGIAIDGNATSRIFGVASNCTVVLKLLTLTNGYASGSTPYVPDSWGGGIYNQGMLTLNACTLTGNSAAFGGGILNEYNGSTLTVVESTLSGNSAIISGGGIYNGATLTVNQSTLVGNSGSFVGGIYSDSLSAVNQSTLTGNSATNAGAGSSAGGIYNNSGTCTLSNTIVAGNSAPANPELFVYAGAITTLGNNLTNGVPLLALLGNYGGPTPTMPPLPGSPAIDGCTGGTSFATDQRGSGYPRIVGLYADIGAVESGNPIPALMVNTAVDESDGPGTNAISLRDAITFAPAGSTIIFAPALSGATILLTNGQITLDKSINIDASALPGGIAIDGNAASRVFEMSTGTTNVLTALTLANGYAAGVDFPARNGGGIHNLGHLTLDRCTLAGNYADRSGGGIYNSNTLTIANSTVAGNSAYNSGGGIFNDYGTVTLNASTLSGNEAVFGGGIFSYRGTVTLNASTLAGNSAASSGGGIYNYQGPLTLNASTLSGNSAADAYGGGIYNGSGTATLNASTLSGNSAFRAGGIFSSTASITTPITSSTILNQCTLTGNNASARGGAVVNLDGWTFMTNCTVTGNTSSIAAGVDTLGDSATETVVANCIIAGNIAGNDLDLYFASNPNGFLSIGGNLIGSGAVTNFTASGDVTNQTAATIKLAPLGNYGGPTPTMPPLTGSPAIDGCINGTSFTTDQRGLPRIIGPFADIGAVEAAFEPVITSLADAGFGSLRYAVDYTTNGSLLTFDAALSGQTIVLTSGQLLVDKNLTIDASALPAGIALNGNHASRIFEVAAGANVMLDSLTLTNGKGANGAVGADGADQLGSPGGAGSPGESGGGILNQGTLTLNRVTLSGNTAGNGGQGGNAPQGPGGPGGSGGVGGAIYNASTGTLNILNSTIANNASGSGGNGGTGGVEQANGGNGGSGGGILNAGILRLTHTTVTDNAAGIRGNSGSVTPSHGTGGGVRTTGTLHLTNTIVALNTAPGGQPDVSGSATTIGGVNFIGNTNGATGLGTDGVDYLTGDPMLDPLGYYGGPTPIRPPLTNSPVVDATSSGLATDQRGVTRPQGASFDIGAVELVQVIVATNPPVLTGLTVLGDGTFQFGFTNLTGASFTVFASTNVALPLNTWSNLGPAVETPSASGQFQFADPQATNNTQRYYRVTSP